MSYIARDPCEGYDTVIKTAISAANDKTRAYALCNPQKIPRQAACNPNLHRNCKAKFNSCNCFQLSVHGPLAQKQNITDFINSYPFAGIKGYNYSSDMIFVIGYIAL